MNKKVINSVLIFFMLVIWTIVFNKLFNFFGNNIDDDNISVNPITIVDPRANFSKDTFNLEKIKRDPFLGRYNVFKEKRRNTSNNKNGPKTKKTTKTNAKTPWPKFSYHGFVKGAKSSSELVLIRMNNKFYKTREGDMLEGFLIKKIYRDSIIVKRKKESKAIPKSR